MAEGYSVPSVTVSVVPDDEDEDDLIAIKPNEPLVSQKGKGKATQLPQPELSGRIGASTSSTGHRQMVGGLAVETRYSGSSTLDEPLSETLLRDVRAISSKMLQVLRPVPGTAPLQDWDLWGPLIACLALAIMLSLHASDEQSLSVFSGIFVIVGLGSIAVTCNAKLLGGKVSFLQSLCVLGYCLFPLDVAALLTIFIRLLWIRLPICLGAFGWAAYAAVNFLGGTRLEDNRAFLAVFPCLLLFFLLAYIILLS